jgi:branched-chain amino acid transport system substrate-binding protein
LGSSEGGGGVAVQAWASSVNAAGGINGHPIKVIVKDDASNAGKALTAVKELITKDKVVAIVGEDSDLDVSWGAYAAQAGVPVVGGLDFNLPFSINPNFYPTGASAFTLIYGSLMLGKQAGANKAAMIVCAETPQCAGSIQLFQGIGQAIGVPIVYGAKASTTASDYTAPCQAAKNSGAQSLFVGAGAASVERISDSCAQQGFKFKPITVDGTLTRSWLTHPSLEGTLAAESVFPFFDTSTPQTRAYRDALTKYAPKIVGSDLDGTIPAYSWAAGKLFEAAAKAANLGDNPTPAQVKKGLYLLKGETLGGLVPPLTFTPGKATVVNCYFAIGIKNGQFTTPHGLTPQCAPQALVDGVASEVAKAAG